MKKILDAMKRATRPYAGLLLGVIVGVSAFVCPQSARAGKFEYVVGEKSLRAYGESADIATWIFPPYYSYYFSPGEAKIKALDDLQKGKNLAEQFMANKGCSVNWRVMHMFLDKAWMGYIGIFSYIYYVDIIQYGAITCPSGTPAPPSTP